MNRRMVSTIAAQSVSPVVLFLLAVVISRTYGAAEQGAFVKAKAWLDVLVTAGCFGFPQSVVYAVNRESVSRRRLYRESCLYATVLLLVFVPMSWLFQPAAPDRFVAAAAFAVGASCVVLSNLWRGILLTLTDGLRFHLITVAPALALVASVSVALRPGEIDLASGMALACGAAGLLALALSVAVFPPTAVGDAVGQPPDYRGLVRNGTDVFMQAAMLTLQTYLYYVLLSRSADTSEAGRFSVAVMAFQACVLPLQMVSPMLFNRWTQRPGRESLDASLPGYRQALGILVVVVAGGISVAHWVVPAVFGPQFESSVPAVQLLLAAVVPAFVCRVTGLRLAAAGEFRVNTLIALSRALVAVVSVAVVAFLSPGGLTAGLAAASWLLGEAIAAFASHHAFRVRRRESRDVGARGGE